MLYVITYKFKDNIDAARDEVRDAHIDHVMGFPFFTPGYVPGTKLKIYGPVSYEDDSLEEIVGGQLI